MGICNTKDAPRVARNNFEARQAAAGARPAEDDPPLPYGFGEPRADDEPAGAVPADPAEPGHVARVRAKPAAPQPTALELALSDIIFMPRRPPELAGHPALAGLVDAFVDAEAARVLTAASAEDQPVQWAEGELRDAHLNLAVAVQAVKDAEAGSEEQHHAQIAARGARDQLVQAQEQLRIEQVNAETAHGADAFKSAQDRLDRELAPAHGAWLACRKPGGHFDGRGLPLAHRRLMLAPTPALFEGTHESLVKGEGLRPEPRGLHRLTCAVSCPEDVAVLCAALRAARLPSFHELELWIADEWMGERVVDVSSLAMLTKFDMHFTRESDDMRCRVPDRAAIASHWHGRPMSRVLVEHHGRPDPVVLMPPDAEKVPTIADGLKPHWPDNPVLRRHVAQVMHDCMERSGRWEYTVRLDHLAQRLGDVLLRASVFGTIQQTGWPQWLRRAEADGCTVSGVALRSGLLFGRNLQDVLPPGFNGELTVNDEGGAGTLSLRIAGMAALNFIVPPMPSDVSAVVPCATPIVVNGALTRFAGLTVCYLGADGAIERLPEMDPAEAATAAAPMRPLHFLYNVRASPELENLVGQVLEGGKSVFASTLNKVGTTDELAASRFKRLFAEAARAVQKKALPASMLALDDAALMSPRFPQVKAWYVAYVSGLEFLSEKQQGDILRRLGGAIPELAFKPAEADASV